MPLIKTVKAGNITHLTDARFFASFEVDYIGFCFDPESASYISPQEALAIKGWISGPKIVAEFANQDAENIEGILTFLEPDVAELDESYPEETVNQLREKGIRIARRLSWQNRHMAHKDDVYTLVKDFPAGESADGYMVLSEVDQPGYKAVHFSGTPESATGIKAYDDLADLLESWMEDE